MTMPLIPLTEMMRRTMDNLRFLRAERDQRMASGIDVDKEGPYEFTQLVNSTLCAFAHPWELLIRPEREKKRKDRNPVAMQADAGLARHLASGAPSQTTQDDLITSLSYFRNAFAHGNIEYLSQDSFGRQEIIGVRIWNCRFEEKTKNWERTLYENELTALLEDFLAIAEALCDSDDAVRERDCPNDPD